MKENKAAVIVEDWFICHQPQRQFICDQVSQEPTLQSTGTVKPYTQLFVIFYIKSLICSIYPTVNEPVFLEARYKLNFIYSMFSPRKLQYLLANPKCSQLILQHSF